MLFTTKLHSIRQIVEIKFVVSKISELSLTGNKNFSIAKEQVNSYLAVCAFRK